MDEIGNILREARELKGLSLEDVYDKLRIRTKFLKALEDGAYQDLPSPAHVRGYLSKYARFLRLEPTPLLERYEAIKHQIPVAVQPVVNGYYGQIEPIPPLPEPEAGTFYEAPSSYSLNSEPADTSSNRLNWIIAFAFIVFVGLISWRFLPLITGETTQATSENGLITAVTEIFAAEETNSSAEVTNPAVETVEVAPPLTDTVRITPTGRTTGSTIVVDTIDEEAPAAPEPTRSLLPATLETIDIQLDITERAWLRVTVDGETVYEGTAKKGDSMSWTATQAVNVRTGNPAGVFVIINNVELGSMGERGGIADETWETTR